MIARAWLLGARARRRLGSRPPDRLALLRACARGRSVVDVGGMWGPQGGATAAFAALDAGATRVTEVDLMPATKAVEAEERIRFVQGDVHEPSVVETVGVHDVVWCAGVLYHAPNPVLTLQRLRALCGERLLLHTAALPELPGAPGATVFYPAAGRAWAAAAGGPAVGLTEPFDAARGYENWWWGLTPSALRGMLTATGFALVEELRTPFHVSVVATPA